MKSIFLFSVIALYASVSAEDYSEIVKPYFKEYCVSCHGPDKKKGGLTLHDIKLDFSSEESGSKWEKIREQIMFDFMPPDNKKRSSHLTKSRVADWILKELDRGGRAENYLRKLTNPEYGNYVSHERLFSGEVREMPFTPSRIWRRSPYWYNAGVRESRSMKQNPFTFSTSAGGIRDYAVTGKVDHSVVGTILFNTSADIDYMFDYLTGGKEREERKKAELRAQNVKLLTELRNFADGKKKKIPNIKKKKPQSGRVKRAHPYEPFLQNNDGSEITKEQMLEPLKNHFVTAVRRQPEGQELEKYLRLLKKNISDTGDPKESLKAVLISISLSPEAIYKMEWGLGEKDSHGRRMLSTEEIYNALIGALLDSKRHPGWKHTGKILDRARKSGNLKNSKDVAAVLDEILSAELTKDVPFIVSSTPRIMRFFHEYFGYTRAVSVFKDQHIANLHGTTTDAARLIEETDTLIKFILREDRYVIENLFTTDRAFVYHDGAYVDYESRHKKNLADLKKYIETYNDEVFRREVEKRKQGFLKKPKYRNNKELLKKAFAGLEAAVKKAFEDKKKQYGKMLNADPVPKIPQGRIKKRNYPSHYNMTFKDWKAVQPMSLPKEQRAGILTQPSWLIAYSFNDGNDPVHRGKWVFEKMLAGAMPDIPPDVNAQVPEDKHKTLRERLEVIREDECWNCHRKMNPFGDSFEIYDHYGRYRSQHYFNDKNELVTESRREVKSKDRNRSSFPTINKDELVKTANWSVRPVNAAVDLGAAGLPEISGEFKNAVEMMHYLAGQKRTRQSFIRHAFRYFMGRNEMLSDSKTLINADKAYLSSGGSFKALVISLLSSDSFLYRR